MKQEESVLYDEQLELTKEVLELRRELRGYTEESTRLKDSVSLLLLSLAKLEHEMDEVHSRWLDSK